MQSLAVHNLALRGVVDETTAKFTYEILPIDFGKDLMHAPAAWQRAWQLGLKGHHAATLAMQLVTESKGMRR